LKNAEIVFEDFAGEVRDQVTKDRYNQYAQQLNSMISKIESRQTLNAHEDFQPPEL
jgi:hypothetical protein